jgi:5-methylcytosine-specific restriction endonuclease McrA
MKILRYNEMFVKTGKSESGKQTYYDAVYSEPTSPKSPSNSLLLKRDLRDKEIPVYSRYQEEEKPEKKKKWNRYKIAVNNQKFLKKTLEENRELRCSYCGKGPLEIYDFTKGIKFNKEDGATCDHKKPISKGGDVWSFTNMEVACTQCNHKKGSMDYDTWLKYLEDDKNKK